MIARRHSAEGTDSVALYSPCESYRYALTRIWDPRRSRLLFIMLNPSTATETANDPTVARCEARARRLGHGAVRVCNLFAWRETHPARLRAVAAPVGERNDAILADACTWADLVICAWGVHGSHRGRGREVTALVERAGAAPHYLGLTRDGHPRHPLYVSYATPPAPWI